MKVFLSWSGNESKQLAAIFKEWLPNVLQYTDPYMSAKDISLGEMWNNNIRNNLEEAVFGLIFVTPSNINAPWINYEAGALSKTLNSKVVPILYHADVMILNEGPLKQFQSAKSLEKDDVYNLLKSINSSNDEGKLDEARLEKAFEVWWPHLSEQIKNVTNDESTPAGEAEPTEKELLNVIFSKLSEQEKWIRSDVNNRVNLAIPYGLIHDLEKVRVVLANCHSQLEGGPFPDDFFADMNHANELLERAIMFLEKRSRKLAK